MGPGIILAGLGLLYLFTHGSKPSAARTPEQQIGVTQMSTWMLADTRAGTAKPVIGLNVTVAQADASNDPTLLRSTAATLAQMGYGLTAAALQIKADRIQSGDQAGADQKMLALWARAKQWLPEFAQAAA